MSTADKLTTVAENVPKVYNAGKQAGHNEYWSAIWDGIQLGGKRTEYNSFFRYEYWSEETFRPKYDMRLTGSGSLMFDRFGGQANTTTKSIDLAQIFEECGVVLDTSQSTNLTNSFYFSSVSRVPAISAVGCTSTIIGTFGLCSKLETIDKFILKNDGSNEFRETFHGSTSLRNIIIEGTIGNSINFKDSPLSKDSILSVFNALSSSSTGQTVTFKKTAKEAAFTADEWATLIATKPNWTISLV